MEKNRLKKIIHSLKNIIVTTIIYKKLPNLAETKVVLKDLLNLHENKVTINQIQTVVCKFFKISKNELKKSLKT